MATPMVLAEQVHKSFGRLEVLKDVSLEVWTGDANQTNRPPTDKPPTALSGDSTRQRTAMTYAAGRGRADVLLPALPNGKVYWVQPTWVNGNGELADYTDEDLITAAFIAIWKKPADTSVDVRSGAADQVDLTETTKVSV